MDSDILSTALKGNPDLHIQYVGIDLSPTYCQLAKDNLKPGKNLEVKILNQNFLDFTDEPFDFIISMHSLYYLPSPEDGVKKSLSLIKNTGKCRIIRWWYQCFFFCCSVHFASNPLPLCCGFLCMY